MKSLLNRYLDGELSGQERGDVQRHVDACATCREALERLRTTATALLQIPEPPKVPSGFAERVVARASQHRGQRPGVVSFFKSVTPPMRVAAAATLVLGLGLGALMGLDLVGGRGTLPDSAAAEPDAVYSFDYFSDAPGGSLADAYMTLASANHGGGR
jgi:anti-sigma factor RsiW